MERLTTTRSPRPSGSFKPATGLRPTAPSARRRSRRSTCRSRRASSSCARISSALAGCSTIPKSEFLVVNIAGFQLYHLRRGEVVWRTRVQVGRPYRQTPIFRAEMTYLVVNPTWTVPPTIFRNDILPAVRRDPAYLAVAQHRRLRFRRRTRRSGHRGLVRPQPSVPARAAAGARQRARPHQVHVSERARGLSARHAEPRSVRPRQPRLQLGLHSRREPVRARRAAAWRARGASASTPSSRAAAPRPFFSTSRCRSCCCTGRPSPTRRGESRSFPTFTSRDPAVIAALAEPFSAPDAL